MINSDLCYLLAPWISNVPKCKIKEITIDSRTAGVGDLFIAMSGYKKDGRCYIFQAITQGVAAVIIQAEINEEEGKIFYFYDVPIIYLHHLHERLSAIAGRFYQQSFSLSRKFDLIGVTGTNGKTTTTHILAQWVKILGYKSAVMGTLGNGVIDNIYPSDNTTSSPIKVQQLLSQFKQQGVRLVAMEVSSHGLTQHRVNDLSFSAAVFTNLTRDHMDYHGNMMQYEASKWRLFNTSNVEQHIINADDLIGLKWLNILPKAIAVSVRGKLPTNLQNSWLYADKITYHNYGTEIFFRSIWGKGIIHTKLIGEFNVNNLLLSLATLIMLGYPLQDLLDSAIDIHTICGRMELFRSKNYPIVFIDYAHTPDALKQALIAVKLYCYGKLWCVFGCGGERDKGKRLLMGAIAERYADYIIITDDNPRGELSQDIFGDIKKGISNLKRIKEIPVRRDAIISTITQASSKDVILIAGKGHEDYQIIGNQKLNCSDRNVVLKLFAESS